MTGTETQLSGRRHGRRARAVNAEEQSAQSTRGMTGNLTLYARRTAVIPPVADEQLPELKRYTGKRAKRRADVPAHTAPEVEKNVRDKEEAPAEKAAPSSEAAGVADGSSAEIPAASVGTKKGSWPGTLRGREADATEPSTEPQTSTVPVEDEATEPSEKKPAEDAQAPAWTSVTEGTENEEMSASEALAPKAADPDPEPAPVYETTDGGEPSDASEWLEVGDLPADQAPEPKPAARFDGTVLHKPSRTSGGIGMWITWLIVAAIAITLIVLLVTGVIGPGIVTALVRTPETIPFDLPGGLAS